MCVLIVFMVHCSQPISLCSTELGFLMVNQCLAHGKAAVKAAWWVSAFEFQAP